MTDATLTVEAAGIMAQVLAVLMLATAFDPAYRGSVGSKRIVDQETGQTYRVPVGRGRYRLSMMAISLTAIFIDMVFVMRGADATGVWYFILSGVNSFPIGALIALTFFAMYEHAKQPAEDKTNKG